MPQIRFRGLNSEGVKAISKELVDNLTNIIGCPRNYFILEVVNSTFIHDGSEVETYPFVEVAWFDRGQEIRDKTAAEITRVVKSIGDKDVDVAFMEYKEDSYYENGKHF